MDVALLVVLIPNVLVPCQYQVSPLGADPFSVIVTPVPIQPGELDVGVEGAEGIEGSALIEALFDKEVQELVLSLTITECDPGVKPLKEVPD